MDKDFTHGQTVESTKEIIETIRNTGKELTPGQMEESTLDNGKTTSDTEEEHMLSIANSKKKEYGKKIDVSSG